MARKLAFRIHFFSIASVERDREKKRERKRKKHREKPLFSTYMSRRNGSVDICTNGICVLFSFDSKACFCICIEDKTKVIFQLPILVPASECA